MKITALCILSLGYSLAILGEAARHKDRHHVNKEQANKHLANIQHSEKQANTHHHHVKQQAMKQKANLRHATYQKQEQHHHHHLQHQQSHKHNAKKSHGKKAHKTHKAPKQQQRQKKKIHRLHHKAPAAFPSVPYAPGDHQGHGQKGHEKDHDKEHDLPSPAVCEGPLKTPMNPAPQPGTTNLPSPVVSEEPLQTSMNPAPQPGTTNLPSPVVSEEPLQTSMNQAPQPGTTNLPSPVVSEEPLQTTMTPAPQPGTTNLPSPVVSEEPLKTPMNPAPQPGTTNLPSSVVSEEPLKTPMNPTPTPGTSELPSPVVREEPLKTPMDLAPQSGTPDKEPASGDTDINADHRGKQVQTPSSPASRKTASQNDDIKAPAEERPRNKDKMVVAYWTDWTSGTMPPEAIPFDKITHLNYAFSIVTPEFKPVFETDYLLNRVVKAAHANHVKVLMSIGGWTGSQYFSPLAATAVGRRTFIKGAVGMVKDYGLDGIDIDWEYPGRLGSACNIFDEKNDAKNFLILLKELRAALSSLPDGDKLQISLATRIVPFDGPDGQMTDVSEFSEVVDHINIMAYDINGSWGTLTGPNAPLVGSGEFTYEGGAQAWIDAGFPAKQINMGVPFYGRSLITKTDMAQAQSMAAPFHKHVPIGDNNDGLWTDPCEKTAAYSGVWKFKNLREQGLVDAKGNAKGPWIKKFDKESQTPWLFNPQTKQFISYDDRESLKLKVDYAKRKGLGGVMLWALNQDTKDFELLNVLQDIRE